MMKKLIGLLLVSLVMVASVGCNSERQEPENVAIVIGNRANSAAPNLTAAEQYIKEACRTYGRVSIITVEGTPVQAAQIDIPEAKSNLSKSNLDRLADERTEEIMVLANQVEAATEEADLMASIILAARALHSSQSGNMTMLIMDSGISTKGEVNFVNTMLESIDTDKLLAKLEEEDMFYDLSNINIIWIGIGDTSVPQTALSEKNRRSLRNVWGAVLSEAGADVTFAEDIPISNEVKADLPKVTVVDVLEPVSVMEAYNPETVYVLDPEVLNFKPDSYELLTEMSVVEQKLDPIVKYLVENNDYKILICGTTASAGTYDELIELSEQRCNTIKDIMVSNGVSEQQIKTVGLGYNDIFCKVDVDADGNFVEEIGKTNRKVIIMPFDSELAAQILSISY